MTSADLLADMDVTVIDTHKIEREMRLFASSDVLAIADEFRDGLQAGARTWSDLSDDQRAELGLELDVASEALLAAMRADLKIDTLGFGSDRSRTRQFR